MIATEIQLALLWRTDLEHFSGYDVRQLYTSM
jgi:hypothetical protein